MFLNLSESPEEIKKQAALILFEASKSVTADSWPTIESAEKEVSECCHPDYIALGYAEAGELTGWAGLRPMYGNITWELHPVMVKPGCQGKGIGTFLLQKIEAMAKERGVLNIILGTDDELGKTSLANKDLYYCNIFDEIMNLKNPGRHPYEFYLKNGYSIIGVVPDASGPGKPDILMGKRVSNIC